MENDEYISRAQAEKIAATIKSGRWHQFESYQCFIEEIAYKNGLFYFNTYQMKDYDPDALDKIEGMEEAEFIEKMIGKNLRDYKYLLK